MCVLKIFADVEKMEIYKNRTYVLQIMTYSCFILGTFISKESK